MPQSLSKNYIHLVFSTKYREDLLLENDLSKLYAYLSGILRNIECHSIEIGGTINHVHILCELNRKITLVKMVQTIKANSSKWIKMLDDFYQSFYWQEGYGAFSVSQSQVENVRRYIQNQKEHHTQTQYEPEYIGLLKKHNVEYDERYIWD